MDIIAYAIPFFFLLIAIELGVQFFKKKSLYRFNDAITNINCGIVQQVTGVFSKFLLLITYFWVYEHYRIWTIQDTWYSYLILLIAVDFCYYLFHRYSHEIAALWGSHVVHHQSEDYNFSVALRQSSLQTFASAWFYLPLALIGFSFTSFIVVAGIQTLYQFWIHTEIIRKLPRWVEFVFNTPSHHRVHHSSESKYINKNHGGMLILFDRMFGTFKEEEDDDIRYGITTPVQSWNTIWVNFEYYKKLGRLFWQSKGLDKIRVLFYKTGWRPDYLIEKDIEKPNEKKFEKYDIGTSKWLNYYVLILFVAMLALIPLFLNYTSDFDILNLSGTSVSGLFKIVIYTMLILWVVLNIGAIMENKTWAKLSELLRIGATFTAFYFIHQDMTPSMKWYGLLITLLFFIIYLTFEYLHRKYKKPILAQVN